ncbi:MAG: lysophospholipid acyltransferase family protein [Gemmatimonadota bacterium]
MSDPAGGRSVKDERKIRWAARLGYWLMTALGSTWRTEVRHEGEWPTIDGRRLPVVLVVWHSEMLPFVWMMRHRGVVGLASQHGDAEIMVRIAERLGWGPSVRGSSTRGGLRGLIGMVEVLEQGTPVGFTPDGPKGPPRVAQPGALIAAVRGGCVVLPVGLHASREWRARSWDRFLVPLPFSRVVMAYGAAFTPRVDGGRVADGELERLAEAIAAAEARASA